MGAEIEVAKIDQKSLRGVQTAKAKKTGVHKVRVFNGKVRSLQVEEDSELYLYLD